MRAARPDVLNWWEVLTRYRDDGGLDIDSRAYVARRGHRPMPLLGQADGDREKISSLRVRQRQMSRTESGSCYTSNAAVASFAMNLLTLPNILVTDIEGLQYWTTESRECLRIFDTRTGCEAGHRHLACFPGFLEFECAFLKIYQALVDSPSDHHSDNREIQSTLAKHEDRAWRLVLAAFLRDRHVDEDIIDPCQR